MVHFCRGRRVGAVVRAYVTRVRFQPGVICGLSLLLILALVRGFRSGYSDFPPSWKPNISKFQVDQITGPAREPARVDVASSLNKCTFFNNFCFILFVASGWIKRVTDCCFQWCPQSGEKTGCAWLCQVFSWYGKDINIYVYCFPKSSYINSTKHHDVVSFKERNAQVSCEAITVFLPAFSML